MPKIERAICVLVLTCISSSPLVADPLLPGIFCDHMVLQQQRDVPIWGWAEPGEKIAVTLGSTTRQAVASSDGRWKVTLPPMKAGGPFLVTVRGKKAILLKDVMFGEVWLLSGQSNMTFALSGAEGAAAEIPAANYPQIRLFTVPQKSSVVPQQNVSSSWKICTPETVKEFSAVGYFFGRELFRKLGVPIGLIHSSWPGTAAEDWSTAQSLRNDPALAPILGSWPGASGESKALVAHPAAFDIEFDDFELVKQPADSPKPETFDNFDDGSSRNRLNGYWTYEWQSAPNSVFQLVQPGRGGSGYAARLSGQIEASDNAMLRTSYSAAGAPADMSAYAGIRFYFRGKGYFRIRSLQPTITDWDDYASESWHASPDWRPVTIWFKDLKQEGWGVATPFTPQSLSGFAIQIVQAPGVERPPSSLFNGMVAPLIPYAIRGVAWYQGEGNAERAHQYRRLLPALIEGWRTAWAQGNFPFLIVQLPNYGSRQDQPGESDWAELREAQLMALRLPDTGLAVTIDLGEADNVHPHRKAEVAQRLALWALGTTYGESIVYSGPLYDSMKLEGSRIRIRFKHAGSGLEARGGELRGFAIAGADKRFHWANADIDGDTVVVSSPEVAAPVAVRYAWAGSPDCNLYNKEGLPASPFRTDK